MFFDPDYMSGKYCFNDLSLWPNNKFKDKPGFSGVYHQL